MKEQIQALLIRGLSQSAVAEAVGCDSSYVSQLMADDLFAAEVVAGRAKRVAGSVELDNKIDKYEELVLDRVGSLIPFISKVSDAARVFGILNAAKRKAAGVDPAAGSVATGVTVTLDLPAAARVQFQLSGEKQVIEIDGRPLATMQAKSLSSQLEARRASRLLAQDVPETLPVSLPAALQRIPLVEKL